jgi:hypothetical protein
VAFAAFAQSIGDAAPANSVREEVAKTSAKWTFITLRLDIGIVAYAVKLDPHPQLFVEFGLMKLNPCRISVSSKSSTIPCR